MLSIFDGQIVNSAISRYGERIDPNAAARVLVEAGHTPAIALAISTGALCRRLSTILLAKQVGLIEVNIGVENS